MIPKGCWFNDKYKLFITLHKKCSSNMQRDIIYGKQGWPCKDCPYRDGDETYPVPQSAIDAPW